MPMPVVVDMSVDTDNCMSSNVVQDLIDSALQCQAPVPARLPRASKARALDKIRDIHEWENCSENSKRFKDAERIINEEFDRLHPDECVAADDDENYSESEDDAEDNLSFVDSDSDAPDDEASWSAAESEPAQSSSASDDDESDDLDAVEPLEDDVPIEERDEFPFAEAVTPTRLDGLHSNKRARLLLDSDEDN